jgi:hypothetical protein
MEEVITRHAADTILIQRAISVRHANALAEDEPRLRQEGKQSQRHLSKSFRLQQGASQYQGGNTEVYNEAGNIDECSNERCGRGSRIKADTFESERQH